MRKLLNLFLPPSKRETWPAPKSAATEVTFHTSVRQDTYDEWVNSLHADCKEGANLQHMKHVFEGYRSFVIGISRVDCPYSLDSIRSTSWLIGFDRADKDIFCEDIEDNPVVW